MNASRNKVLLSLTAIAVGAMLSVASVGLPASAQTTAPPVKALTMEQLNKRVATPPELASLKSGDLVTISDDGKVTGKTWQGTYEFRPAGSVVTLDNMYLRWKDGLVAVTQHMKDGKPDGTCDCTFVEQNYAFFKGPDDQSKDKAGLKDVLTLVGQKQTLKPLATEPTDNKILRIPGNAWLYRDIGNGQYITLVDAFIWKSGEKPVGVAANAG